MRAHRMLGLAIAVRSTAATAALAVPRLVSPPPPASASASAAPLWHADPVCALGVSYADTADGLIALDAGAQRVKRVDRARGSASSLAIALHKPKLRGRPQLVAHVDSLEVWHYIKAIEPGKRAYKLGPLTVAPDDEGG